MGSTSGVKSGSEISKISVAQVTREGGRRTVGFVSRSPFAVIFKQSAGDTFARERIRKCDISAQFFEMLRGI